jgi:hypothetical protein
MAVTEQSPEHAAWLRPCGDGDAAAREAVRLPDGGRLLIGRDPASASPIPP